MRVSNIHLAVDALTTDQRHFSRRDLPSLATATTGSVQISDYGRVLLEGDYGSASSASAVMSRYDPRNISYTELVNMADELRDIGALKSEDYLDFIGPSPEFGSLTGEAVAGWNAPTDYVAMHEQKVAFLRASGAESRFIEFASYQLSLFRHFESLHFP